MYISKVDNALRWVLLNSYFKKNESILITEYPKSGGSWLGKMISQYYEINYPQREYISLERSVLHGHYLPRLGVNDFPNTIVMRRDPRDVMVSYYFHINFRHENNKNRKENKLYGDSLNLENRELVRENLPQFIEFITEFEPKKWQHFFHPTTWTNFYKQWNKMNDVVFVTYRGLLRNTYDELHRVLHDLGEEEIDEEKLKQVIENNSFEKLAKRKNGTEKKDSFLRKGIIGDWKNYFTEEGKEVFKKYYQKDLEKFGYEENRNW